MSPKTNSISTGKLAVNELPLPVSTPTAVDTPTATFSHPFSIAEDDDDAPAAEEVGKTDAAAAAPSQPQPRPPPAQRAVDAATYTWRIDLAKTETFWAGWFEGLSQKFLDLHVPKLLLLANIDGLDRALTVGQMQGRFQLQVLARSGHVVHEDQPHEVADIVGTYMVRNKFARATALAAAAPDFGSAF